MATLELHEDRFFDPNPTVRRIARELYHEISARPLVCPHGHVPAALLSKNDPFPEPTSLIFTPDHYIFRMLYSQGLRLEDLGIPTRDGTPVEDDPRVIWQTFGEHYHLFRGTPTRAWLDYEFYHVFDIRKRLSGETAMEIYDQILEKLQEPSFRPRSLYDRFDIEVLATTDRPGDSLEHHRSIQDSDWEGQVIPSFRPDATFKIAESGWGDHINRLADAAQTNIHSFDAFVRALETRREDFKKLGATATDHGVRTPHTERLSAEQAERIFQRALAGDASKEDQTQFEAHMLMEMARMSVDDGLVMQIHPGSYRNHNVALHERFGADVGADIPVRTEYTRNLRALLNAFGTDPDFTLVVFTLDESTYGRELAPLAGHYPAMRIGPPWWFFDSIEGMRRYRRQVTETAGFYNTAGFNDDTRAFLSIPARHDLSRRLDANYVATLVARHQIDMPEAHEVMQALSGDLARETYNFGDARSNSTSVPQQ